ncbi:MAG: hypothetical protein FWD78_04385 [Treponema sp.]|nr:hypothetical protein [Treponema sp.]
MAKINFLQSLPHKEIAKYSKGPPKNGIPFIGHPRQHPVDNNKLILIYDPIGVNPMIMEFKLDDIIFIEELPATVTETGESIPQIKLWIRRGARGIVLEPFEVDEPIRFIQKNREFREKFFIKPDV